MPCYHAKSTQRKLDLCPFHASANKYIPEPSLFTVYGRQIRDKNQRIQQTHEEEHRDPVTSEHLPPYRLLKSPTIDLNDFPDPKHFAANLALSQPEPCWQVARGRTSSFCAATGLRLETSNCKPNTMTANVRLYDVAPASSKYYSSDFITDGDLAMCELHRPLRLELANSTADCWIVPLRRRPDVFTA